MKVQNASIFTVKSIYSKLNSDFHHFSWGMFVFSVSDKARSKEDTKAIVRSKQSAKSSRFPNCYNCLIFLCSLFLFPVKFPKCQEFLSSIPCINGFTECEPAIFRTSDKCLPKHISFGDDFQQHLRQRLRWYRNMCNFVAKNSAETNKESSSISDISQGIEGGVSYTSFHYIWTNSFHVFVLLDQRLRYFKINYSHEYRWNEIDEEYPKCTIKSAISSDHDGRLYKTSWQTCCSSYNQSNKVH